VNRLSLTPQLAIASGKQRDAVRRLARNSIVEIVLGFCIFAIVGMLGTLHPAIHFS
jgi:putative copper resistance protein D